MDFKKVKFFSYGVLLSVFLLIAGIVGVKYIGDYYINTLTGDLVVDAYQKIKIIRWVIIVLFSVTLFISYISLLIQTCRIDESNESHFYIVMSMLSIIPLCALTLIVRTSHLQLLERNKKIKMLTTSLENEIEEKNQENNESLFYDSPFKETNEILDDENINVGFEDKNLTENSIYDSNDNLTYENDSFDKMEKNKFNKKKYLSLKGTIYSKEKKEGKKKIPNNKWEELENLVKQLELFEIDEETFYLKKEELLSK